MMSLRLNDMEPTNEKRPGWGALASCFGSGRSWEQSRISTLAGRGSHKTPDGATGEFVPMSKRITSGIESTPMQLRPIDRVALRVVRPGTHYIPKGLKELTGDLNGEAPPPVNVPLGTHDLTGVTIGQLVVVRYLGHKTENSRKNTRSRWLVRCLCGTYEHRTGRSLRRQLELPADPWPDRCEECQNLQELRGEKRSTSTWQDEPIPLAPLLSGANDIFVGGERFGHLTVIGYGGSGSKQAKWVTRCDCGAYGLISAAGLKSGNSPQCDRCYAGSAP